MRISRRMRSLVALTGLVVMLTSGPLASLGVAPDAVHAGGQAPAAHSTQPTEQAVTPTCPATLGSLVLGPDSDGEVSAGRFDSFTLICRYGVLDAFDNYTGGAAFAVVKWTESGRGGQAGRSCGVDDWTSSTGRTYLHDDATIASAQFGGEDAHFAAAEELANSLMALVATVAQPCSPEVYCPPPPDGMRIHRRPSEVTFSASGGSAGYDCFYNAAPDNSSPPDLTLEVDWIEVEVEGDRQHPAICAPSFDGAGLGNPDFEKYLTDEDRRVAVRYIGHGNIEAVALAMAKDIAQFVRDRAIACPGAEGAEGGDDTPPASDTATATPAAQSAGPAESPEDALDRRLVGSLNEYFAARQRIDTQIAGLFAQADTILRQLRDAQFDLLHGSEADKAAAETEIARIQALIEALFDDFEELTDPLEDFADLIEAEYDGTPREDDAAEMVAQFASERALLRLNLALHAGDTVQFDELFRAAAQDENIATPALVANAFRQLMEGDARIALESVRNALERDPDNAIALQLRSKIELTYLQRIRNQISRELGENARLFEAQLNSHGDAGVGQYLIDLFTTAPAESALAVAGYYDLLEGIAAINLDEGTEAIAGLRLLEDLLSHGLALEELNDLSVERMQEIAVQRYNRDISPEQASSLREKIFDAFKNVDVDAIRKGERTQFNVDIGRDYFDTEVLEPGAADFALRQFSAWDVFLTFAPSAQLGKVAQLEVAAKLGLTATSTVQQGLQRGLRIQELGARIYQNPAGAAAVDAAFEWRAMETMIGDAVKARVGSVAYASGSVAVSAAIDQLSAPAKAALAEDLRQIGDYYLGAQTVGNIEATAETLSAFFGFVGLNAQELERGAYGAEHVDRQTLYINGEIQAGTDSLQSEGVSAVRGIDQRTLEEFEADLAAGGDDFRDSLTSARASTQISAASNPQRRVLAGRAGGTIDNMQRAADALDQGDREAAQQFWEQAQAGAASVEQSVEAQVARLADLNTLKQRVDLLGAASTPNDRSVVSTVIGKFAAGAPRELAPLTNAITAAGMEAVPKAAPNNRLSQ